MASAAIKEIPDRPNGAPQESQSHYDLDRVRLGRQVQRDRSQTRCGQAG
jgi:hypothetical protein